MKLFFQVSKEFFEQIYSQDIESTNEYVIIEIGDEEKGYNEIGDEEKEYNQLVYKQKSSDKNKHVYFYKLISILKNLLLYIQFNSRLKNE